jgi:hypothetical protein
MTNISFVSYAYPILVAIRLYWMHIMHYDVIYFATRVILAT